MAGGRAIPPLHAGHVGLLCMAGMLNGVFGQGDECHNIRLALGELIYRAYGEDHRNQILWLPKTIRGMQTAVAAWEYSSPCC